MRRARSVEKTVCGDMVGEVGVAFGVEVEGGMLGDLGVDIEAGDGEEYAGGGGSENGTGSEGRIVLVESSNLVVDPNKIKHVKLSPYCLT